MTEKSARLSEQISKILPEKLEESLHEEHMMDDTWCYDCGRGLEDSEIPCGNHKFNQAIDKCHASILKAIEDGTIIINE